MRRLWLRWALLIVFVAILGVVFVSLGSWQLDRLDQRKARNSTTLTNESRPVRPFTDIFTGEIRDADQWQRVEARGTYDAEHQFLLRYRRNGDAEGYEVVTASTPAVVSVWDTINEPRYPSFKDIMAAKKKEIRKAGPPPAGEPSQQIVALYVPEKAKKTELLSGSPADAGRQLVAKLRDEARVIQ